MRAFTFRRYGGVEQLTLEDVPTPQPKDDEVLVRLHAASINDWDWELLHGRPFVNRVGFGLSKPKVRILGGDVAGVVEASGPQANRFKAGDEVFGDLCFKGFGCFAEYVCAPESCLAPKSAAMSFEEAAAIPQAGMLAVQGLFDVGGVQPDLDILLNGAGGGVGTFAIQLLRPHNTRITVVDHGDKLPKLQALGADEVIDYRQQDFTRAGKQYDLILDAKTTRSPWDYARALKKGGAYVTVGGNFGRLMGCLAQSPLVSALTGRSIRLVSLKPNKDLAFMCEQVEAGVMRPVVDSVYPLEQLPTALTHFGESRHIGKIVIRMGDGTAKG
jgi:NADPH:quinone reductase-like Zn-dependent oxidoreductase